jgi:hypothetical protein
MQLACAHCGQVLEFANKRPSFCAYCGKSLPQDTPRSTVEFDHEAVTRPPEPAGTADDADPAEVGGYRLRRVLGEGGMGKVYEAEDAATGRRVALKLIAAQYADSPDAVERFRREGRLASALAHPRCVFVLAADEEAGRPYIVMELMPGETLEDLIRKQGPLSPEQALPRILDVIEGLKEAHRVGVVHRDVKPSNCFLERDDRVKIGDFGLAKSLVSGAHLTKTGSFLGTVLYAAPEQIKGEPIGPHSDVYSVAATLYCLLTGQAPFHGSDPAATLARAVSDAPPPMRSLRPELPQALDQVVLRGLERDRNRRWRNLEEFEAALRQFLPATFSLAGLSLRFAAFTIDYLLILTPLAFVELADWLEVFARWAIGYSRVSFLYFVGMLYWFTYFGISEGVWSRSLGKRLLGLRVARAEGAGALGVVRTLTRTGAFFVPWHLDRITLWYLFTTGTIAQIHPRWLTYCIQPALAVAGVLLLVSTMRSRNGYRGLHEWASGTRVIRLPEAERPRALGTEKGLNVLHPAGLLDRVGSFNVLGVIGSDGPDQVLLGEDPVLGRKVFLWMRPSATGVPIADGRRGLSRATRPRWLSGGRHGDQIWDAFLAPTGQSLPDLVSASGRLSWAEVRPLLTQLVEELNAGEQDTTLPSTLAVGQVWVQSDGRLQLLDVPLAAGPPPAADALTFLPDVLFLVLEGNPRCGDGPVAGVRAPLPQYAARLLGRLFGSGEPYRSVGQFSADLAATADKPSTVSRGRRFAHLAVQTVFLYVGLMLSLLPLYLWDIFEGLNQPPFNHVQGWMLLLLVGATEVVLWSLFWRGGLSLRLLGLSLVRADGRPAGRLQCAGRTLLVWGPVTLLLAFWIGLGWNSTGRAALALLPIYLVLAVWSPQRALHDWLAGTYLVPR